MQRGVIRVAVVDDLRMVTDGLVANLSRAGHRIEVVIQADTWFGLLEHPSYPADVTVLDLNLGDGISIAVKVQALRAAGSEVVVISRHSDAASVARAMQAGALGYVPKTDTTADLVAAIRAAARGERHLAEPLAAAIERTGATSDPGLGQREYRAIALYAGGRTIREVAGEMLTTEETVKSYIKRARRKFRDAGVELGTKALLRSYGIREGWVELD